MRNDKFIIPCLSGGLILILLFFLPLGVQAADKDQIRVEEVTPQTVASIRTRAPMARIGEAMGELYHILFGFLASQGLEPAGPPLALYFSPPAQEIELDACVPIFGKVPGAGRIKIRVLPGALMARLLHIGPYKKIGPVYERFFKWLDKNSYQPAGPSREIYLIGPMQSLRLG